MQVLFTVYRREINITENTEPRKISKDKKKQKKKQKKTRTYSQSKTFAAEVYLKPIKHR